MKNENVSSSSSLVVTTPTNHGLARMMNEEDTRTIHRMFSTENIVNTAFHIRIQHFEFDKMMIKTVTGREPGELMLYVFQTFYPSFVKDVKRNFCKFGCSPMIVVTKKIRNIVRDSLRQQKYGRFEDDVEEIEVRVPVVPADNTYKICKRLVNKYEEELYFTDLQGIPDPELHVLRSTQYGGPSWNTSTYESECGALLKPFREFEEYSELFLRVNVALANPGVWIRSTALPQSELDKALGVNATAILQKNNTNENGYAKGNDNPAEIRSTITNEELHVMITKLKKWVDQNQQVKELQPGMDIIANPVQPKLSIDIEYITNRWEQTATSTLKVPLRRVRETSGGSRMENRTNTGEDDQMNLQHHLTAESADFIQALKIAHGIVNGVDPNQYSITIPMINPHTKIETIIRLWEMNAFTDKVMREEASKHTNIHMDRLDNLSEPLFRPRQLQETYPLPPPSISNPSNGGLALPSSNAGS